MKKTDILMFHSVKRHISDIEKIKSSEEAVEKLVERFNEEIKKVIKDAGNLAQKDRRKTILLRDVEAALKKNLGKVNLSWQELLEEFLKQNPTDLGRISEGISTYLREHKK